MSSSRLALFVLALLLLTCSSTASTIRVPAMGSDIRVYHATAHNVTLNFTLDAFPTVYTHGVNVAAGRF